MGKIEGSYLRRVKGDHVAKVLADAREAMLQARSKVFRRWDSEPVNELHREIYDLLTAAFPADWPEALGECVDLTRRASTDSAVTTDDGPGCFYCDQADDCAEDCPARAALATLGEK